MTEGSLKENHFFDFFITFCLWQMTYCIPIYCTEFEVTHLPLLLKGLFKSYQYWDKIAVDAFDGSMHSSRVADPAT